MAEKYILQFCGGLLDGEYRSDNPIIKKMANGINIHVSQREELQGKPTFAKYAGPMYNGTNEEGLPIIRYEAGGSDRFLFSPQIFILYSCDEWASYSTFRVIMATTSLPKLLDRIMTMTEIGEIEYNMGDVDKIIEDYEEWGNDKSMSNYDIAEFLNNRLTYAHIGVEKDGG